MIEILGMHMSCEFLPFDAAMALIAVVAVAHLAYCAATGR